MIRLTCIKCHSVLEMDDAFAGGVCRCQHCGTIQTVPVHKASAPARISPPRQKVLYQAGDSADPRQLESLAQAVASSGLAGSGLQSGELRQPLPKQPGPTTASKVSDRKRLYVLLAAAGSAGMVVLLIVAFSLGRRSAPVRQQTPVSTANSSVAVAPPGPDLPTAAGPNVFGVPLAGPTVVYLLDRGQGTGETFEAIKIAAIRSAESLGPSKRFQIIFWETDSIVALPADGPRKASAQNCTEVRNALAGVYFAGQSRIENALARAIANDADEIVLMTGKWGLDEQFSDGVVHQLAGKDVKVHTFSIGPRGSPDALRRIASECGGEFREIGESALRELE